MNLVTAPDRSTLSPAKRPHSSRPAPPQPTRRSATIELTAVAGVAALIVAGALVAAWNGWRPDWDTAFLQLHVLDIFTGHPPLVGMSSTLSSAATELHHPGPLQFWLLAIPFAALRFLRSGLMLSQSVVNAALATLAILAAGRGRPRLVAAGALTTGVVAIGPQIVHDPWNPAQGTVALIVALVTTVCFLASRRRMALIVTTIAASLAAQSHLSAAPLAAGLVLVCIAAIVRAPAAARRASGWPIAVLVGVLCWSGPLVDVLRHRPGNLWRLTGASSSDSAFGVIAGFDRLARAVTPPGLWSDDVVVAPSTAWLWVARLATVAAIGACVVVGRRGGVQRHVAIVAGVAAATTVATQAISPDTYATAFGGHIWNLMWPAVLALWAVVGLALAPGIRRLGSARLGSARLGTARQGIDGAARAALGRRLRFATAAAVVGIGMIRALTAQVGDERDGAWFAVIDQVTDQVPDAEAYVLRGDGVLIESELIAGVGAELARRGIDVRFSGPMNRGVVRLDRQTTNTADGTPEIVFRAGPNPPTTTAARGISPLIVLDHLPGPGPASIVVTIVETPPPARPAGLRRRI